MLRVRVVMQPLAGGEAQTIWDRPIVSRNAGTRIGTVLSL